MRNEKLTKEILGGLRKVAILQAVACTHCPKFLVGCTHMENKLKTLNKDLPVLLVAEIESNSMGEIIVTLKLAQVLEQVCDESEHIAAYLKKTNPTEFEAFDNDLSIVEQFFESMDVQETGKVTIKVS